MSLELREPRPRRRARLPPRGAAGRRPAAPAAGAAPGSATAGAPADRARHGDHRDRSCRRSVPRSTTCHAGTTRRSWAGPTSSAACWRTSSGRSAGRSSAVLLAGDAGVGKTRLLDELDRPRRRARRPGARSGTASTSATSGCPTCRSSTCCARSPATRPRARVRRRTRCSPGCSPAAPGARPPVPPASEGRDLSRPLPHRAAPQPVDDGRLQLFESVAGLICELAAAGAAADRAGGRALGRPVQPRPAALPARPAGRRAGRRGRLLPRRRPAPPASAAPAAGRAGPAARRRADRAGAAAATPTWARWSAGWPRGGGCRSRTVDDVVARAEGNAFYAEELLAAGLHGEALPLGLTDVLLARVEQRSPAAQQVLRIAAVAGRRVRHELVAAVGGLATGELEEALAEAVHHHLLVVSDDGRYRFRHALLREAVLADLLPGERVRLHASIAAYLRRDAGRRHGGRAGAPRAGEQRPAAAPSSASLEAAVDACSRRGARRAAAAPGGGARAVVGGARRRGAGRPRPGRRCCWRRRPPRARWGSCTGRSRCCARPWRCSGRTPIRRRGPGSTTRWPRRWCGSRTTPAPTARAPPRWRWCRRSRRRRCAPGRRPRTRG